MSWHGNGSGGGGLGNNNAAQKGGIRRDVWVSRVHLWRATLEGLCLGVGSVFRRLAGTTVVNPEMDNWLIGPSSHASTGQEA